MSSIGTVHGDPNLVRPDGSLPAGIWKLLNLFRVENGFIVYRLTVKPAGSEDTDQLISSGQRSVTECIF